VSLAELLGKPHMRALSASFGTIKASLRQSQHLVVNSNKGVRRRIPVRNLPRTAPRALANARGKRRGRKGEGFSWSSYLEGSTLRFDGRYGAQNKFKILTWSPHLMTRRTGVHGFWRLVPSTSCEWQVNALTVQLVECDFVMVKVPSSNLGGRIAL
jgi:hypothetical protein